MFEGNGNLLRGQVTVNHGSVEAATRQDITIAFQNAEIGDRVVVSPVDAPEEGIIVVASPAVQVANQITVSVANITAGSVTAGTAVLYNVTLIKNTGESNVP